MTRSGKILLAAGWLLLTGIGCRWLPDGEPPPGNIVSNPDDRGGVRSFPEAQEYFTALVSLESAAKCPGAVLRLRADAATVKAAAAVLRESGYTSGIRRAGVGEAAAGELRSRLENGLWRMELRQQDRTLWCDEIQVREK